MESLVEYLKRKGTLKSPILVEAFLANDRSDFVPVEMLNRAYEDHALSIGFGQSISQPYTVAFMMELLQPERGNEVLDVGFGSGWTTGILANAVGIQGKVFAVEIIPDVFRFGEENLQKYNYTNVELFLGSWEDVPPRVFDRILVSAAADSVPEKLIAKLRVGGKLVIPVRTGFNQSIRLVEKVSESMLNERNFPGFVFVPLV